VSSLVGRESELGAVEDLLRSERSRVVAIVGEPGIGKTTLWQAAVEHARAQGARVLVARPTESEARLAFAGLADLLADLPDELFARLPDPQRVGLDVALLRTASARAPERRVVGAGFLTLLRSLAGESEVVCAIDDLHWLDASSAAGVEFALRRLAEGEGFEPSIRLTTDNGFRDSRGLRPERLVQADSAAGERRARRSSRRCVAAGRLAGA
jgi:predicted ATPase